MGGATISYFLDAYSTSEREDGIPIHGMIPRKWDVDLIIITPIWEEEHIREVCRDIYGGKEKTIGIQDFCAECLRENDY